MPVGGEMDVLELSHRIAQDCISQVPVIVLGSGASVPHGIPGMGPLGEHLAESLLPAMTTDEVAGWEEFCEKIQSTDLETALTEVTLSEAVTQHIVRCTWDYLNSADIEVFYKSVLDRDLFPLSRLYKHLFNSTASQLEVVTPNYDRIAEYAAEVAGYYAYTGFTYGMLGQRAQQPGPRIYIGTRPQRTVNIWKVHGSCGWFSDADGVVVALPPMPNCPAGLEPLIVTPGIEKYRRTHDEPFRTTIQNADAAIRSARAFLCIGYGFNDTHLQPLLVERCNSQGVPLVLITRTISEKAHEFLKSGKCRQYLALEKSTAGTRIYSNERPDGAELVGKAYWQLGEFLSLIM